MDTIKIRFGSDLNFTSKLAKSQKTEKLNKNCKKNKIRKKILPRYCIEKYVYQILCRLEDI